jgi:hypothetical protein
MGCDLPSDADAMEHSDEAFDDRPHSTGSIDGIADVDWFIPDIAARENYGSS